MKERILSTLKYLFALIPFILLFLMVQTSLDWGLPNRTINDIILPENEQERDEVIREIVNISNNSLRKRESFVIEGKSRQTSLNNT